MNISVAVAKPAELPRPIRPKKPRGGKFEKLRIVGYETSGVPLEPHRYQIKSRGFGDPTRTRSSDSSSLIIVRIGATNSAEIKCFHCYPIMHRNCYSGRPVFACTVFTVLLRKSADQLSASFLTTLI
jgi:hypothetical protein